MSSDVEKKIKRKVRTNKRWIFFWIVIFVIVAVVLGSSIFSQNRVDINSEAKVTYIKSLTCTSEDYLYPFFIFDNSNKKELKLIVTFTEDDVRSFSLQQILYYENDKQVAESEALNHAAMNDYFEHDGMGADALGASYSPMHDGLRFGIYGSFDKLKDTDMKYFLINNIEKYDYNRIRQIYEESGLKCDDSK